MKSYSFYLNFALAAEKQGHNGFTVYWMRKALLYKTDT